MAFVMDYTHSLDTIITSLDIQLTVERLFKLKIKKINAEANDFRTF